MAVLLIAAYGPAVDAGFTFDSGVVILQDARLRDLSWPNLHAVFTQDYWSPHFLGLYRPLTTLSFALNYQWLGSPDDPRDYRLLNLALHAANALWVGWLLHRAFGLRKAFACMGAGLFALHPVMVESVTNLVGRSDLLAAFFVLAGWWAHREARDGRADRRSLWLAMLALCAVAGVLCKESALVLVGVLALDDALLRAGPVGSWADGKRLWNRVYLPGYLVTLLPLVLVWAWRTHLYKGIPIPPVSFTDNALIGLDFGTWQINAWKILVDYIGLILWPARLSVDYSYNALPLASFPPGSGGDVWAVVSAVSVLALIGLSVAGLFHRPHLAFGVLFFFGTLLPASNILKPVASIMGERFLYLPSVGIFALLAWGVQTLHARMAVSGGPRSSPSFRVMIPLLIAGILLALGTRTWIRNGDWKDNPTLFRAAVRDTPGSSRNHSALASSLYQDAVVHLRLETALPEIIRHARLARSIMDGLPPEKRSAKVNLDLATYLSLRAGQIRKDDPQNAQALLAEAEALAADIFRSAGARPTGERIQATVGGGSRSASPSTQVPFEAARLWGEIRAARGNASGALEIFEEALKLHPAAPGIYRARAEAWVSLGETPPAVRSYLQSLILGDAKSRETIWPGLRRAYLSLVPPVAGVVDGPQGPRLDSSNPKVQEDIQQALREIHRRLLAANRLRDAASFRESALRQFGQDPGVPDPPTDSGREGSLPR